MSKSAAKVSHGTAPQEAILGTAFRGGASWAAGETYREMSLVVEAVTPIGGNDMTVEVLAGIGGGADEVVTTQLPARSPAGTRLKMGAGQLFTRVTRLSLTGGMCSDRVRLLGTLPEPSVEPVVEPVPAESTPAPKDE
jgi:hypothetical protein